MLRVKIFYEPNFCSSWHRLLRRTLVQLKGD